MKTKKVTMNSIGVVRTSKKEVPRHWVCSRVEGELVIDKRYGDGLKDMRRGEWITVLFYFHKSEKFTRAHLIQSRTPNRRHTGVFSICSPLRPNPIGLSVVEVIDIEENKIHVCGLDMYDGTPILDIKPYIEREN